MTFSAVTLCALQYNCCSCARCTMLPQLQTSSANLTFVNNCVLMYIRCTTVVLRRSSSSMSVSANDDMMMSSTESCAILGTGVHDAFASGSEDWGSSATVTTTNEMPVVNGSNHQSPRAAASAARKLLDTVGEEHSDTKDTSSSSDIPYSISIGNGRNSATDDNFSDWIDHGHNQYSDGVGLNDGRHGSKNSNSLNYSSSSSGNSKHHDALNELAIVDLGGAPGEVDDLIYDDRLLLWNNRALRVSLASVDDLHFKEMSLKRQAALVRDMQHVRYKPGDVITRQGDTADCFYIVIGPDNQASVSVLQTTPDSSEEKEYFQRKPYYQAVTGMILTLHSSLRLPDLLQLNRLSSGRYFGERGLLYNSYHRRRSVSVKAATHIQAVRIDAAHYSNWSEFRMFILMKK
eukprot:2880-Heterococcus_DN1.PRE.4